MSSLKTKIRLSTALAFSATLGMAATTALIPATVVAAESEISAFDFNYPIVAVPSGQYVTVHPTFRGGDEGSTVWSLDNQTGAPLPQGLNASLNPTTGAISFIPDGDTLNTDNGEGEYKSSETFYVRATRDGQSFDVPVTFNIQEDTIEDGKLAYNINGRSLYDSSIPTIDTAKVHAPDGDVSDASGSFHFDKESPFWQPRFDEFFEMDETNGSIKALKPLDFSENFSTLEGSPYRIILPIVATADGLEGEHHVPVQISINPFLRTVAPMKIDPVTVKAGETATRDLYFLVSSEFFGDANSDGSIEARKRYAWSDGSYDQMPTIVAANKEEDPQSSLDRFEPRVDYPNDFPEWIKWDPVTRVASVEPPADLEPGTYTYDFYFSYGQDDDAINAYMDEVVGGESSKEEMKSGGLSDLVIEKKLKVPFVVTVAEKDAVLPDTDEVADTTGSEDQSNENNPVVDTPVSIESAPVQDSPVSNKTSSPVRGVLASTGANVTTLVALGLLAMVAGAAFLASRRRTS